MNNIGRDVNLIRSTSTVTSQQPGKNKSQGEYGNVSTGGANTASATAAESTQSAEQIALELQKTNDAFLTAALKEATGSVIIKALKDAHIPQDEQSINAVSELVRNGLPVERDDIISLMAKSEVFTAPMNIIALMTRLGIEINTANIEQFTNYINMNHTLSKNIENIIDILAGMFSSQTNGNAAIELNSKIIEAIFSEQAAQAPVVPAQKQTPPPITRQAALELTEAYQTVAVRLTELNAPPSLTSKITSLTDKNLPADPAEVLKNIETFIKNLNNIQQRDPFSRLQPYTQALREQNLDNIKNLLADPAYGKILKAAIEERWLIKPENIKNGEIGTILNRVNSETAAVQKSVPELTAAANREVQLAAVTQGVRDNLNLMDKFSENMVFLQLPLKLTDNITNSDLYVFADRKSVKKHPGDYLNILLKLDLERLGELDIYVNINEKVINSRFYTKNNEAVIAIEESLPELTDEMAKLGFSFGSTVSETDTGFDFVKDFIDRGKPEFVFRHFGIKLKV